MFRMAKKIFIHDQIIYRNLQYCPKHSFSDILRNFDEHWTFVIDFVNLLSSTPKSGVFHVAFQMLRREQHCEF